MDQSAPRGRLVVVAPKPLGYDVSAALDRIEALYGALEAQGAPIAVEYLRPATREALAQRLAQGDAPILYFEGPTLSTPQGQAFALEAPDGEDFFPWQALGEMASGASMVILGGLTDEALAAFEAPAQTPVVLLRADLMGEAASRGWAAFWEALLSGRPLTQATEEASRQAEQDPLAAWLGEGGERAISSPKGGAFQYRGAGAEWTLPLGAKGDRETSGIRKVVRFPSPDLSPAWQRLPSEPIPGGLPPEPPHGFLGRGQERATLERWLTSEEAEPPIWLYGYEGLGKTSLILHMARWLVRTGRFERVVYTSFAGGNLPEEALYDAGQTLLGETFPTSEENPLERLAEALRATKTLIIWDDLETILAEGEAPLPAGQIAGLKELAHRLNTGPSRLCLIVNGPTLPGDAPTIAETSRALALEALPLSEALALLGRTWQGVHHTLPERATAEALLERLGGHPFALVILAHFAGSLAEGLEGLRALWPGLDEGEARLRNQALEVAIAYALNTFDEGARSALGRLGIFAGGMMSPLGRHIAGLEEASWAEAIKRLEAAHLLRTAPLPGLTVPLIRLHPALGRTWARQLTQTQRAEIEERFLAEYGGFLGWLGQLATRAAKLAETLFRLELANLRRAVEFLLARQEVNEAMAMAQAMLPFLRPLGFRDAWNLLASRVSQVSQEIVPAEGPLGRAGVHFLLRQSEQLAQAGRLNESAALLQELNIRINREDGLSYSGIEATLDRGAVLHNWGRVLRGLGRPDVALGAWQLATQLLASAVTREAQQMLVSIRSDMADVLIAAGQFDEARALCEQALGTAQALEAHHTTGTLRAQLGNIALAEGEIERARQHFRAALELLEAEGDANAVATLWRRLGQVAWRTSQDAEEAQDCFDQALSWAEKAENIPLQGQILFEMADVAEDAERPADAEARLSQALGLYQKHGYLPGLVAAETALSAFYLRRQDFATARAHAEAALNLAEQGGDSQPWSVYTLLQQVAEAEGKAEEALTWRLRAQEAFASSPAAEAVRQRWGELIRAVAASCRGEALEAEAAQALEKLEESPEWHNLAEAIWRVIGGERGEALFTTLDYMDAVVIRAILQEIAPSETTS